MSPEPAERGECWYCAGEGTFSRLLRRFCCSDCVRILLFGTGIKPSRYEVAAH